MFRSVSICLEAFYEKSSYFLEAFYLFSSDFVLSCFSWFSLGWFDIVITKRKVSEWLTRNLNEKFRNSKFIEICLAGTISILYPGGCGKSHNIEITSYFFNNKFTLKYTVFECCRNWKFYYSQICMCMKDYFAHQVESYANILGNIIFLLFFNIGLV